MDTGGDVETGPVAVEEAGSIIEAQSTAHLLRIHKEILLTWLPEEHSSVP